MTQLVCKLCNGDITRRDDRGGIECGACGSLMVEQVPSMEELSKFYANFNSRYTGGGSSGGKNQILYAQRYLELVKRHSNQGSLLDMGCANNPFPNVAAHDGFKVTAMDYSRPDLLDANVHFEYGHLNSTDLLRSGLEFDVVTSWAVIEHVADPDLAFAILSKLLKKGGQLHLTTPEYGTSLTSSSAGRTRWFYPPEHLHMISPAAMRTLARRHGLKLVEWRHFEIGRLRWLARYGIGAAETLLGTLLRTFNETAWESARVRKTTRYIGIAYYRFTTDS
jgi:2-polyprenyl-3-methyl-5-hydroxy-6-metoxy-1,4-benzoquinol methylase